MGTDKVPLVIYTRGERVVLGEASVVTKDGDMVVESVLFEKHHDLLKDNSEFSLGVTYNVGLPAKPFEVAAIPHLKVKENEDGTYSAAPLGGRATDLPELRREAGDVQPGG